MPYIIVTGLYPTDKVPEVTARMQEMRAKYPLDEKLGTQVVAAAKNTLEGLQIFRSYGSKERETG